MDPLTKFTKQLRTITLSDAERVALRASLLAKMRESVVQRPVPSPWSQIFFSKHVQAAFLSVIIVIGYGSSVSLAAEGALPGDILYPVKTRVTEPVARLIKATSPAAEAKFETRLLEKRLEEAESLETGKKLDLELKQEVRKVIREQSIKAKKKIKDVESDDGVSLVALSVATSTTAVATSSPEATREKVEKEKQSKRNDDSDDKEKGKNKRALKAVLEKHVRILEKLDLADEHEDEREDKGVNGADRDKKKEE